jgi:hypothetical protein
MWVPFTLFMQMLSELSNLLASVLLQHQGGKQMLPSLLRIQGICPAFIFNDIVPYNVHIVVQIRLQVHISERLSVLGLTRHGFVLCRKGVSVDLKGVSVVYKLPFASSTKRCETILMYPEHLLLKESGEEVPNEF